MASPSNDRPSKNDAPGSARPTASDGRNEKKPSSFQLWFEDAWEGWVRPVGTIVLLAVAFMLYKFDLVSERLAGTTVVVVVLLGTVLSTALPAWGLTKKPLPRFLFALMMVAWAAGTAYPSMRAALPGKVLGETRLREGELSAKLHLEHTGPYDVTAAGNFKSAVGEVEASYQVQVSDGANQGEVSGLLKRTIGHWRTRKGGTTSSTVERNEQEQRLARVMGPDLTLTTEGVDDKLDGSLLLQFRRASLPKEYFWAIGALGVLFALFLDVMLTDGKTKLRAYATAGMGISLVFSIAFALEATPHALVSAAVGGLLLALAIGGLGGWLLSGIARMMFLPKPPKKVKRPRPTPSV